MFKVNVLEDKKFMLDCQHKLFWHILQRMGSDLEIIPWWCLSDAFVEGRYVNGETAKLLLECTTEYWRYEKGTLIVPPINDEQRAAILEKKLDLN